MVRYPETAPSLNYARHRTTGQVVFFEQGNFRPTKPDDWAVYHPIPRLHHCRVIGEDEDIYRLRQLHFSPHRSKAWRLLRKHERGRVVRVVDGQWIRHDGLEAKDRARIAQLWSTL